MKTIKWHLVLIIGFVMLLSLAAPALIRAQGPTGGEEIGLASQPLQCLVVGPGSTAQVSGTVNLTWEGKVS